MTKVLHVITGLGLGGAERSLVQVACGLQSRGMPQHVVSVGSRGAYADAFEAHGVPVDALKLRSESGGLHGLFALVRLIGQVRPNVVQGWMYHGNVLAALAHRLVKARLPSRLFWNLRASNMDDARYRWIIRASALLSRWPDVIIANSQAGLAYHKSRGFRPRQAKLIANGIDVDVFRPDAAIRAKLRGELGISPDAIVALHVARVDPMKDHASFLAAMKRLPQVSALLVGTGTETLPVPANTQALGQRRDVAALCACADIIVSTSAFGEGFSNVLAEGMSAGLIPVATDVGDSRLIVDSAGYITSPSDVDALTTAISGIACLPKSERRSRGALARSRIVQNFTLAKAVDAYEQLYKAA